MATKSVKTLSVNKLIRAGQQRDAIKNEIDRLIATFTLGSDAHEILRAIRFLDQAVEPLQAVVDDPTLIQLAKNLHGDQTYDVSVEYAKFITAITAAVEDIIAMIPLNSGGFVLLYSIANRKLVPRPFTGEQLAPLVTRLNEILIEIE